jgi:predicted O-linked N-acetylglucosamine transferase (SPINDLY family)
MSGDPSRAQIERGRALLDSKQIEAAAGQFNDILRADPASAEAWHFLGVANAQLGNTTEAESNFREALAQGSPSAHTPFNLANILLDRNKIDEAITSFQKALEINPAFVDALANLTLAYTKQRRFEEAIEVGRRAIAAQPESFEAYTNLGLAYLKSFRFEDAAVCYRHALRLRSNDAEAHVRLGVTLAKMMKHTEAMECFRNALTLEPRSASTYCHVASSLQALAQFDEAIAAYRSALEIDPKYPNGASGLLFMLNYLPAMTPTEIAAEHRALAQRVYPAMRAEQRFDNLPDWQRKLRIGYVSPDFREHSVAYFIGPILATHDPARIEVFCYANVDSPDGVTEWLRSLVPHWRDITDLPDAEAARLVRNDQIDILIDLAGHTDRNRLGLFCLKPAPVQASYLGYPNTTGLSQIDYRLTDAWADPPGHESVHSEMLARLPGGFLCYGPRGDAPAIKPSPVLANGYVTFVSFNNLSKINADVIRLWARLLNNNTGSRLLLKGGALSEITVRQRILGEFLRQGLASDRIELTGWAEKSAVHLDTYSRIDIALDTFPYNGTTTTCEALWMGVPIVTLAGNRHAGRVGVSLLTQVGLTNLIAGTPEEYVDIAVQLASDRDSLADLRLRLRDRMAASPLCDHKGFTRGLEAAYRQMWREWCATQGSGGNTSGDT